MRNPNMAILAILLTAVEEALLRTTLVWRDSMFRSILGEQAKLQPHREELVLQDQSLSAAVSMLHEVYVRRCILKRHFMRMRLNSPLSNGTQYVNCIFAHGIPSFQAPSFRV